MSPRRLRVFGLAAVALAALLSSWLLRPRPSAITLENAAKVKEGMTLAEVEAILDGPPRDDSTGPLVSDADLPVWVQRRVRPLSVWQSDEVILVLQFDDSLVTCCAALPVICVQEGPLDMLRRWLHL